VCERCKTPVERKNMSQWFFKITDYAERLLENTYKLNWSEKVLATQRNWIGKSKGAEIVFELEGSDKKVTVFTTRPDTLYGCTFFCLAPEHPLVNEITPISYKDKVSAYRENSLGKTEQERKVGDKDKTGEFTGAYVINPVNGKRVPVWVADYVLMEYGEGAVMGVPAHDERDFAFAQKYGLEIVPVIDPQFPQDSDVKADKTTWREEALKGKNFWTGPGRLINSQEWNGLVYPNDLDKVIEYLEDREIGKRRTTYKLRDWCISRQRYWGPPIPMIYCPACAKKGKSWFSIHKGKDEKQEAKSSRDGSVSVVGWYPEPEENLPVELPEIEDYLPDGSGKSPLARHEDFYKTTCPHCGGEAYRETDVSDTFLDSSWYFLRYPSTNGGDVSKERSQKHAFDPELTQKWLPVSQYCGGAEHSVLHLLYSRFITMALHDMGHLNFEEPFPNFYAHGLIIKDGAKMSKSRGNVVNPDEYIQRYGTDVLRMYLSFIGPYSDGGDFRDTGIAGMERFVRRVWRLITTDKKIEINGDEERKSLESSKHSTIKRVTEGIERFKYNTSIAALMEYVNYLEDLGKHNNSGGTRKIGNTKITSSTYKEALNTLILLIAPFAPHLSEEAWQKLNGSANTNEFVSVHTLPWPKYEKERISADIITIAVQVNGKLRSTVDIPSEKSSDKEFMLAKAKEDKRVERFTGGKKIIREIVIPGKLVNLVVS
ncbi:MAG: class I tRNA ligase family protein, partial [Patescibacteria group bacterium]